MPSRTTVRWWWALLAVAVVMRVWLFSGYGLGDDPGYFACYHGILRSGQWWPERVYDWRFAFWIPVVTSMRIIGVTDWGFVGFVTLCGVVNVVLVWALARQEWDEPWAPLVAMALMAVFPLEVLSSTLFVIDIPLATWCYGAFWLYREALAGRWSRGARVAAAVAAGACLFLGYSTKQWAVLVGALFAFEALRDPRATWRWSALCAGTFLVLIGAYVGWQWVRFGDPLEDFHVVRRVAIFLPHSWAIVTDYSRMLLLPTDYGTWFAGWYPHAVLLLAVLFAFRLRRAGKWLLYFLIELACLSAMPSHWENGHFVLLVPHIFRYLCFLSIPLCLALAAYWREALLAFPRLGTVALTGFLALTVVQAVALTGPTRDAFGEQRRAAALLLDRFPDEEWVSDGDFLHRARNFAHREGVLDRVGWIRGEDPVAQARELAAVKDAVVVTGGARLPWYGCMRCATTLAGFTPPPSWRLVTAYLDAPLNRYRREPLRIWHVSEAAQHADELLRDTSPTDRLALLRSLVTKGDWATAVEVGRRLGEDGVQPGDQVAYLAGLACARSGRPRCAVREFDRVLAGELDQAATRNSVAALATAAVDLGDFDRAHRWVAEYHERFPDAPPDDGLDEISSGMAEGIARYHRVEYAEAERLFAAIRDRESETPARRQRAHYFLALTLFREAKLPRAVAEADAYRARYGADPSWIELAFRNAEARRMTEPAVARALFEDVARRYPNTYWAEEASRIANVMAQPGGS
jgi:tetratricopeptide (TPR) repeat protein